PILSSLSLHDALPVNCCPWNIIRYQFNNQLCLIVNNTFIRWQFYYFTISLCDGVCWFAENYWGIRHNIFQFVNMFHKVSAYTKNIFYRIHINLRALNLLPLYDCIIFQFSKLLFRQSEYIVEYFLIMVPFIWTGRFYFTRCP